MLNAVMVPNTLLRQPWWARRICCNLNRNARLFGFCLVMVRLAPMLPNTLVKSLRLMRLRKLKRFKIFLRQT